MTTQLDRIETKLDDFITLHNEQRVAIEQRITRIETSQSNAGWIVTWLSGIVAAVVAGVVIAWAKLRGL